MTKLVIAGAFYYDEEDDMIIVPHYTGEYSIVDCDRYVNMKILKEMYNDRYIKQVKDNPIELRDKKYYDAEYSPISIRDTWELLSDLSKLRHQEENYDFD